MKVPRCGLRTTALFAAAVTACCGVALLHAQGSSAVLPPEAAAANENVWQDVQSALIRLPLAGVLGAALALRPKRLGTPERTMPVVETQIILSIVGALIMLVVGASLARAFGIVGAANLIRYRAKIDNPKDAVVMLATLAVGLACGVGLYALSVAGTLFVGAALWIIEGFEPEARKSFELNIGFKHGQAATVRPQIEHVLRRYHAAFELRSSADDSVSYRIEAPSTMRVDRVSAALEHAAGDEGVAVEWDAKKEKQAS
jgi:uncharacterized membrane protein YhiD involved in acid resistance